MGRLVWQVRSRRAGFFCFWCGFGVVLGVFRGFFSSLGVQMFEDQMDFFVSLLVYRQIVKFKSWARGEVVGISQLRCLFVLRGRLELEMYFRKCGTGCIFVFAVWGLRLRSFYYAKGEFCRFAFRQFDAVIEVVGYSDWFAVVNCI